MKTIGKQCLTFLKGFLVLNIIWLIFSYWMDTAVVPSPFKVYENFVTVFSDGIFLHIYYSLRRIFIGLALSLIIGIPTGILMAYSEKANSFLYPLVYFGYPVPKTALLPIAMLLWGMRDGSKIAIIFFIIVFQVIVSVRDSVVNIDNSLYQTVISSGGGRFQIIRHITLPAILPQLFTSIRVSLGTAVSILIFIEGYGTGYGMGYYILDAWSRINYIQMYMGILVISFVGFALFVSADILIRSLCPWLKGNELQ